MSAKSVRKNSSSRASPPRSTVRTSRVAPPSLASSPIRLIQSAISALEALADELGVDGGA